MLMCYHSIEGLDEYPQDLIGLLAEFMDVCEASCSLPPKR